MEYMPILFVIFYSIPESLLIFMLALGYLAKEINWPRIITATIISVIICYVARAIIPGMIHKLLSIVVICMLINYVLNVNNFIKSFMATLVAIAISFAVETIYLQLIFLFNKGFNLTYVFTNLPLRMAYSMPILALYSACVFYMYHIRNKKCKNILINRIK